MRNDLPLALRRSSVLLALTLSAGVLAPAMGTTSTAPDTRVLVTSLAGDVSAAADAVRAAGGRVLDTLTLVGGVSAELPAGTVLAPSYRIVPDAPMELAKGPDSASSTAISVRRALGLGAPSGEGEGVTVAVVDTGVAAHADLGNRVSHVDVTGTGPGDDFGHGTFVAGLIAGSSTGVAPAARILDVRVADDAGSTTLLSVLKGLQVVAAHPEVDVLNLSLSSGSDLPYQIDPLTVALETLWRRGVTVVVPAGNGGDAPGTITSPGLDPVLLTVGALDDGKTANRDDDVVPVWSGRGPAAQGVAKPDLVAPGKSVVSLRVVGSKIDVENPSAVVGESYFKASGTSFSTATASGAAAALLAERPSLSPFQVKAAVTGSAYRTAGLTDRDAAGFGGLDLGAALDAPAVTEPSMPPGQPKVWHALGQAMASGDTAAAASSWSQLSPAAKAWVASSWSQLSPQTQAWLSMNWAASSWSAAFASMNWAAMNWAAVAWAAMNWAAQNWAAMNWAASSWSAQNWAAQNWAAQNWAAQNWAAQNWAASSWSAQLWASMNWARASSWSAQNWSAQNWAALVRSSQNWAGQNWAGQNWAGQNWAGQNWAGQNWASQNWAGQNWAGQNWASQNWG